MNKSELIEILNREGIRPSAYNLTGSFPDYQYCLEEESHGIWYVYYSERGVQYNKMVFVSESEACEYLLNMLKEDSSNRG